MSNDQKITDIKTKDRREEIDRIDEINTAVSELLALGDMVQMASMNRSGELDHQTYITAGGMIYNRAALLGKLLEQQQKKGLSV